MPKAAQICFVWFHVRSFQDQHWQTNTNCIQDDSSAGVCVCVTPGVARFPFEWPLCARLPGPDTSLSLYVLILWDSNGGSKWFSHPKIGNLVTSVINMMGAIKTSYQYLCSLSTSFKPCDNLTTSTLFAQTRHDRHLSRNWIRGVSQSMYRASNSLKHRSSHRVKGVAMV